MTSSTFHSRVFTSSTSSGGSDPPDAGSEPLGAKAPGLPTTHTTSRAGAGSALMRGPLTKAHLNDVLSKMAGSVSAAEQVFPQLDEALSTDPAVPHPASPSSPIERLRETPLGVKGNSVKSSSPLAQAPIQASPNPTRLVNLPPVSAEHQPASSNSNDRSLQSSPRNLGAERSTQHVQPDSHAHRLPSLGRNKSLPPAPSFKETETAQPLESQSSKRRAPVLQRGGFNQLVSPINVSATGKSTTSACAARSLGSTSPNLIAKTAVGWNETVSHFGLGPSLRAPDAHLTTTTTPDSHNIRALVSPTYPLHHGRFESLITAGSQKSSVSRDDDGSTHPPLSLTGRGDPTTTTTTASRLDARGNATVATTTCRGRSPSTAPASFSERIMPTKVSDVPGRSMTPSYSPSSVSSSTNRPQERAASGGGGGRGGQLHSLHARHYQGSRYGGHDVDEDDIVGDLEIE